MKETIKGAIKARNSRKMIKTKAKAEKKIIKAKNSNERLKLKNERLKIKTRRAIATQGMTTAKQLGAEAIATIGSNTAVNTSLKAVYGNHGAANQATDGGAVITQKGRDDDEESDGSDLASNKPLDGMWGA